MIICGIFEELRKCFSAYEKLDNPQYNRFSPYQERNKSMYDTHVIEFDIDEEIAPVMVSTVPQSKPTNKWSFSKAKETTTTAGRSVKWALFDKKNLDEAVRKFQTEADKLRIILPMIQAQHFTRVENKLDAIGATIQNRDAERLGLVTHARLIQASADSDDSFKEDHEMKDRIVKAGTETIELSVGSVEIKRPGKKASESEVVLVELKPYPPPDEDSLDWDGEEDVRHLAALLRISSLGSRDSTLESSTFRTLPFQGYVNQSDQRRYAFIYGFPLHAEHSQPISLHDLIKSTTSESRFPLKTRFRVAQMIAQSIGVFHADRWVHKSVCSQSIVFFKNRNTKAWVLDSPYLVDFEYSRPVGGRTFEHYNKTTDSMTLYLHPDRPRLKFTKLHDLYALGVVLLEIATWTTAKDHFQRAAAGLCLDGTGIDKLAVQEHFKGIAQRSIPYHMGTSYSEAVVSCLNDTYKGQTGDPDFTRLFQDNVVEKLSAKSLL